MTETVQTKGVIREMTDWRNSLSSTNDRTDSLMQDMVFQILQGHRSAPEQKQQLPLEKAVVWIDGCGHLQLTQDTVPDGAYWPEQFCYYLDQNAVHEHKREFDQQIVKQLKAQGWLISRFPYKRPTWKRAREIAQEIEGELLKARLLATGVQDMHRSLKERSP